MVPMIGRAIDVKDLSAKGNGKTADNNAVNAAILGAVDGLVEFPRGSYRITRNIDIQLSQHGNLGLSGPGASASMIMSAGGPACRFIGSHDKGSALPSAVKLVTWEKARMPLIGALEISEDHPIADGIKLRNTFMTTLPALLIRNVRNGIHLTSGNRNVLIDAFYVYSVSGIGIFLYEVNIHQFIISDSLLLIQSNNPEL